MPLHIESRGQCHVLCCQIPFVSADGRLTPWFGDTEEKDTYIYWNIIDDEDGGESDDISLNIFI